MRALDRFYLELSCCSLALALLSQPAAAASDPARLWSTLTTDHFAVHYYDGGERFARRVAAHAEEAWGTLNEALGWTPEERVHMLAADEVDSANGFASVMPYDAIAIWAFPPEMDSSLGDYDDWLRVLVFHEYAHIAHIDRADGIPRIVNRVLGKTWKPNQALPRWFTEGVATWVESTWTAAGRVGSSRFEMILRTAALAGKLPKLSELTGPPLFHPRSTAWYMYGGYLFDRIARGAGPEAVRRLLGAYGRRLIPYAMNLLARRETGKTLVAWHEEVLAEVRARAEAHVARLAAEGRVEGRQITEGGEERAHPQFTPDGRHLVWVHSDGHETSYLVMAPTEGLGEGLAQPRRVLECEGGCGRFTITRDGRDVLLATRRPNRQVNSYLELARLRLAPDQPRRSPQVITRAGRTHHPQLTERGDEVWVVRSSWGETWLEALDARTGASRRRWDPPAWARIDAPQPHPDGRRLFATMHHQGNRDLVEIDLRTGRWRRLTWGRALELQPTLTRDGRWLVYASDATGVYDIYARDVSGEPDREGRTFRLTRVMTGAFEPAVSPDGTTLVYVGWTWGGDELYLMPFAPESGEPVVAGDPRPAHPAPVLAPVTISGPQPYDPLPTMLPRTWTPSTSLGSGGLSLVGLSFSGTDITGRLSASLSAEWDFARQELSAAASVGVGLGYPDLRLTLGRFTRDGRSFVADTFEPYSDEVLYARLEASVSLPDVFVGMRVGAAFNGDMTRATRAAPVIHSPDEQQAFIPREGLSTSLELFWNMGDTEGYPYGISTARGIALSMSLRLRDPALGSHASSYTVRGTVRGWLPVVRLLDHVATLQLRVGFAGGDPGARGRFAIGGIPAQDLVTDLINQTEAGTAWLRGYRPDAFRGSAFQLLTAEYRLPLLRLRRGLDTLPISARDLSLAIFSDAARIYEAGEGYVDTGDGAGRDPLRAGVGAELRLTTDLFFSVPLSFRLGFAHGFGDEGIDQVYFLMAGAP